ncbi:MAG: DUF72 domain-containing protein [bacterium]
MNRRLYKRGMDRDMNTSGPGRRIRIGCSGWSYPHWRGRFYPEGMKQDEWFAFYSSSFDTVEINNTFYQLPQEDVFRRWEKQASGEFVYAVKVNRYLTHVKKLHNARDPLEKFIARVRLLGGKQGPLLYQLPPRWTKNYRRLESFLDLLPGDMIHVFEFRDQSWMSDDIFHLLDQHGCSFCIHDMPGLSCPRTVVGPVCYLRFHGTQGKYQGGYSEPALKEWAAWIEEQAGDVYAYFNNDALAHAVYDARQLKDYLKSSLSR